MTVFVRALGTDDKAELLQEALGSYRAGQPHPEVYETDPTAFEKVPNSPFAYWVSENILNLFQSLPRFESEERTVKQGLATADDFRFVRLWTEVPAQNVLHAGQFEDKHANGQSAIIAPEERDVCSPTTAPTEKAPEERHVCSNSDIPGHSNPGGAARSAQTQLHMPSLRDSTARVASNGYTHAVPPGLKHTTEFQTWCRERTQTQRWVPFAKGGEYSPFYSDLHLAINWGNDGQEINTFERAFVRNHDFYFRPGLTWSLRSQKGLSFRPIFSGGIFSHKGPVAFAKNDNSTYLLCLLATTNSTVFQKMAELQMSFGSWEVGVIQRTPLPISLFSEEYDLANLAYSSIHLKRFLDTANEFSHVFHLPALLQTHDLYHSQSQRDAMCVAHDTAPTSHESRRDGMCEQSDARHTFRPAGADDVAGDDMRLHTCRPAGANNAAGDDVRLYTSRPAGADSAFSLSTDVTAWNGKVLDSQRQLADNQRRIDDAAFQLFGITGQDRQTIEARAATPQPTEPDDEDDEMVVDAPSLTLNCLSYMLGSAFGRWDIRYATDAKQPPELPDPFAPLPVCPPGMLQNAAGLPAEPQDVPEDYPLRISWPGILVDDEGHPEDIVARLREALTVIWPDNAGDIEQEACDILSVKTLRDYVGKPAKFFADHLKRYSKSRRQAPIYWPLSTTSGSYTLWLYYHRLTDQTLYTCVNDFVNPKLQHVSDSADALRRNTARSAAEERELTALLDLEAELQEFRDELLRIAQFWKPDLNDGVQITAAPLWKLFKLPKWQKTLKDTWKKLEHGDYDWSHLAGARGARQPRRPQLRHRPRPGRRPVGRSGNYHQTRQVQNPMAAQRVNRRGIATHHSGETMKTIAPEERHVCRKENARNESILAPAGRHMCRTRKDQHESILAPEERHVPDRVERTQHAVPPGLETWEPLACSTHMPSLRDSINMGAVNGATHISLLWNYNGIDSMADTYLQIYLHIVFAVQGRQNLLHGAHREEVNKYITGIVTNNGQKLLAVGGMPDHTHVLVGINRAVNFADLVRDIKANSSRFINEQRWLRGHFRWQEGYGGFSYSRSQLHEVIHYILKQEEHHRKRTFKEEYTALLKKFEVEYDERYLFEWIDID